jgi:hypothetical protein
MRFTAGCKGPAKQRENEYNKHSIRNISFAELGQQATLGSGAFKAKAAIKALSIF